MRVIEVPVDLVAIDEARFTDRDRSQVFEDLVSYLSLVETLPAISVRVDAGGPVVTRGHKYLLAARRLGRQTIRAVVESGSASGAVSSLMSRPDVTELDWTAIEAQEHAHPVVDQWHVFHFVRPLDESEKDRFTTDVAGFFTTATPPAGELLGEIVFEGDRARFRIGANIADERWYASYLAAARRFHNEVAPIATFQGARLQP